mgnify:CR=1 FL=1
MPLPVREPPEAEPDFALLRLRAALAARCTSGSRLLDRSSSPREAIASDSLPRELPSRRPRTMPWKSWTIASVCSGRSFGHTSTTGTTAQDSGIIVTAPAESGSNLPAKPFTMSGTAAPNMHLKIEDEGQTVAESTADGEGNWHDEQRGRAIPRLRGCIDVDIGATAATIAQ